MEPRLMLSEIEIKAVAAAAVEAPAQKRSPEQKRQRFLLLESIKLLQQAKKMLREVG